MNPEDIADEEYTGEPDYDLLSKDGEVEVEEYLEEDKKINNPGCDCGSVH